MLLNVFIIQINDKWPLPKKPYCVQIVVQNSMIYRSVSSFMIIMISFFMSMHMVARHFIFSKV